MNRKIIGVLIAGVVFAFAAYNLWSYFEAEAAKEAEEARQAEIRRTELEQEKQRQAQRRAEQAQERQRVAADKKRQEELEEQKKRKAEEDRLAKREGEKEAKRLAKAERRAKREVERLVKLRSPENIEGIAEDRIEQLVSLSPRYIRDNPEESLKATFGRKDLSNRRSKKLIYTDTNLLMIYAAVSQNLEHLKALIDIGIDINAKNEKGFSAFHFASAYNKPEVIQFFSENGADTQLKSYHYDMDALHIASWLNPNPDSVKALLGLGFDPNASVTVKPKEKEKKPKGRLPSTNKIGVNRSSGTGAKNPLMIAAKSNRNLEIVETLVNGGADTSIYNDKGQSFYYVVEKGNYDNKREYKEKVLALLK